MAQRKSASENLSRVSIFVNGACRGNPGPGGWAAITRTSRGKRERSGGTVDTTNNRMELTAAIVALEKLKRSRRVTLFSDSRYVIDGAMIRCKQWKQNGWRTAARTYVKNVDLWKRLDVVKRRHEVEWRWAREHGFRPDNARVNDLARAAIPRVPRATR